MRTASGPRGSGKVHVTNEGGQMLLIAVPGRRPVELTRQGETSHRLGAEHLDHERLVQELLDVQPLHAKAAHLSEASGSPQDDGGRAAAWGDGQGAGHLAVASAVPGTYQGVHLATLTRERVNLRQGQGAKHVPVMRSRRRHDDGELQRWDGTCCVLSMRGDRARHGCGPQSGTPTGGIDRR
jgi:hypothetical protein